MNNEQDRYSQLLNAMKIPKSTRATMTIWGFNILDLGAIVLGFFAGMGLNNITQSKFIIQMIIFATGVVTAILLIMRTNLQPGVRNWRVVFAVLTQDKSHYYPIRFVKKGRSKHV